MKTVLWYVSQKYNWQSNGMIEGDYDELTIIYQEKKIILFKTLSNKITSDTNKTLTPDIIEKIISFLPIKKGVVVVPDEVLPRVISYNNLENVCEKIASSNHNHDFNNPNHAIISIAKAYLHKIGKNHQLSRSQFLFVRDELVECGTVLCPDADTELNYRTVVTLYGIIGYLLNDENWIDTYLKTPTVSFVSN